MLKKLDWYIIRKFLGTFFFTMLLFILVAVVMNLSENVDDFIEDKVPFKAIIFEYYFNFIPNIVLMLSPLFIFIAVIFFTSRLASRSEIVAILSSGVSFYRILFVPYLLSAIFLLGLQYYANHYLVPSANLGLYEYEQTYERKNKSKKERNIHMQIDANSFVTLKSYQPRDKTGQDFILEIMENDELKHKVKADKIKWNEEEEKWELTRFVNREIKGEEESLETGEKLLKEINLTPKDFGKKIELKEALTTPELDKLIEREKLKGSSTLPFLEVERHRRTSVPFATIVLTFIGFAIASRKTRGGMGLHILLGIGISSLYVVMMQFSTTFATNGDFSPLMAVWLPNIIFALVCVVLIWIAPK